MRPLDRALMEGARRQIGYTDRRVSCGNCARFIPSRCREDVRGEFGIGPISSLCGLLLPALPLLVCHDGRCDYHVLNSPTGETTPAEPPVEPAFPAVMPAPLEAAQSPVTEIPRNTEGLQE